MNNTSILTVTYDVDLDFLKYNLKSISHFCEEYAENVVVLDDHESDCVQTQEHLENIKQKYFINKQAKQINRGYIRQQYIKLFSDQYVSDNCKYICHVDSDNIFTGVHTPDVYFKDGKPIVVISNWNNLDNHKWKPITDHAVGYDTEYEFMRRMPLIYPVWIFAKIRNHMQSIHGDLISYLNSLKTFSEYNALGAFAYKYFHDDFYWIDQQEQRQEWVDTRDATPCVQYSNRSQAQPHRYVDLSVPGNKIEKIFTA